jgi:SAM-dependent methyltransferase
MGTPIHPGWNARDNFSAVREEKNMHASSLENMQKCYERYICNHTWMRTEKINVVDIGGANVNGTYRDVFSNDNFNYLAVDIEENEGVDIILENPYKLPFEESSIDILVSGQVFEHVEYFWELFEEFGRILKDDGFIFLIAPSSGPVHNYPVDCYRFYPDSYKALARKNNIFLIDFWLDKRGPWKDLVGVFSKHSYDKYIYSETKKTDPYWMNDYLIENQPSNTFLKQEKNELNKIQGKTNYLEVIREFHSVLQPEFYFEIGVRKGASLSLSDCETIGVDPEPDIDKSKIGLNKAVYEMTSDSFFEYFADKTIGSRSIDLAFIDGMHLFEFVLRDFINIETYSDSKTIVLVDDILPNNEIQAERVRKSKVWTGDVWKFYFCLKKYRPDLELHLLDTSPSGMLVIKGLDKYNQILVNKYNTIINEFNLHKKKNDIYLGQAIKRHHVDTEDPINRVPKLCNGNKQHTSQSSFKLSVVVVSYNMNRELPRTLQTMRSNYQIGIKDEEVEIIVVDNGSKKPCSIPVEYTNVKHLIIENPAKSPAYALNFGIKNATSGFICAMVDGARMLSPGVFKNALKAKKMCDRVIVSTVGFHLGPEVQMESVTRGYSAEVEDDLLKSVNWEVDGYSLFSISTFAGSSSEGWFSPIAESNALFMPKALWDEVSLFDERFLSSGGGLLNLDMYVRACELPETQLVSLLGEGTFHQIHGGIATNCNDTQSTWEIFHKEYKQIKGKAFKKPEKPFILLGELNEYHQKSLEISIGNQILNPKQSRKKWEKMVKTVKNIFVN